MSRKARTLAALLAAAAWLPAPVLQAAPPVRQAAELGPGLAAEMQRGVPAGGLRVIVKLRGHDLPGRGSLRAARIRERKDRVLAWIARSDHTLRRRYDGVGGFALRAGRAALLALQAHPEVERIYLDGVVRGHLAQSTVLIGSDLATLQGYTGAGVTVAVLDSGIDTDHTWLMDDIVVERCWCAGCCQPPPPGGSNSDSGPGSSEDDNGHGTAVSGIITSGWSARPGVAPDAGIASLKVLDHEAVGNFSDIDTALAWVASNHATYDIRVVNMSLGDGQELTSSDFPCTGSTTTSTIANLLASGITVVASSGNEGHTAGVAFPACIPGVIAVGSVYDSDVGSKSWSACVDSSTAADQLVCHTNRGNGMLDVLAPGHPVTTTWNNGASKTFGGTSAAAPFVAATAALLYEEDPGLTPAGVRTLITTHGPLIPDPGMPSDTWPRVAPAEILTTMVFGPDSDSDGVSDDGDGSGLAGDSTCTGGNPWLCDDNCPFLANPSQDDPGGVGNGSAPNGIGTACECGDLNLSGHVDDADVGDLRQRLADPTDPTLPPDYEDRCTLQTGGSGCGLVQAALLRRNVAALGPAIEPVCDAATGP